MHVSINGSPLKERLISHFKALNFEVQGGKARYACLKIGSGSILKLGGMITGGMEIKSKEESNYSTVKYANVSTIYITIHQLLAFIFNIS